MTTYLDQPCPRSDCGAKTLQYPKRNKNREYCYCETCKRKVQYVRPTKDGGHFYRLVIVGASGDSLVSYTFRLTPARLAALKKTATDRLETVSNLINLGIDLVIQS